MQNIGEKFRLSVYSQRWGHNDTYKLTKTEEGWLLTFNKATDAPCDRFGHPTLEKAFTGESISYPNDLEYFISEIWDASQTKSKEEVQGYFDQLGEWMSTTEKTKPNFSPLHL
ncbi:hypothetical protein SAMN04487975_107134 [Planococcus glaciei]|uniref:hypothetical protein n=1 Tax=Planococcus glaciei TaxID=459472 RepID=UPI00088D0F8D|nr:hypothetical protein [Planococcus glaciei]SDH74077.1 hypothetical protein SAMN04487975_107134 [Planococcus glaciei]